MTIDKTKKQNGQFYTIKNPFDNEQFRNWIDSAKKLSNNKVVLEPFAGSNNIPKMLKKLKFDSFDIKPGVSDGSVIKRDTIKKFPKGYEIIITNPPYLEKSSAKRYKINYNKEAVNSRNLYLHCIDLMLENANYVAAIVPVSFKLRYLKYKNRIQHIIEFGDEVFFDDTNQEIILVLFSPGPNIPKYTIGKKTENIENLEKHNFPKNRKKVEIIFNNENGNLGFKAIHSKKQNAKFVDPNDIKDKMKISSRNSTKILLPNKKISEKDIVKLNEMLNSYRKRTMDFFTSSFYHNKTKRKRINYKIVRNILEEYYGC